MCGCGRPEGEHGMLLFSGGPEALPEDGSARAVAVRKATPKVRVSPDGAAAPEKPPTARTAGGTPVRRRTAKQKAQIAAWQRLAREGKG